MSSKVNASTAGVLALVALLASGCGEAGPSRGTAVVTGTTMDAATREPVADVEVVGPLGAKSRSDGSGRFRLEGLRSGDSGEVVGRAPDGRLGSVALRPLASGEREIVLYLRAAAGEDAGTAPHQD